MGKSPAAKRLVIWIDREWVTLPVIQELVDKGHTVLPIPDTDMAPHLILSKHPHFWAEPFWSKRTYLDAAVKRARERKGGTSEPAT